jgi:hypothetical protein
MCDVPSIIIIIIIIIINNHDCKWGPSVELRHWTSVAENLCLTVTAPVFFFFALTHLSQRQTL